MVTTLLTPILLSESESDSDAFGLTLVMLNIFLAGTDMLASPILL